MHRRIAIFVLSLLSCLGCSQTRIQDVIYLKQGGAAFTMDVFKPRTPNRAAVIFLVSGGWFSAHESINPDLAKAFNDQGFTVFEVVHGSQPRYKIPEIVQQVRRAVRFVHSNSDQYGIDSTKVGVMGISAGGHLSMMIGGLGDDGTPTARDPVDRASSRVDAIAEIAGPTDFQNWGKAAFMPFDDPQMTIFIPAFGVDTKGPREKIDEVAKATSPITYVNPKWPPTLLVHGDTDKLVPVQQAQTMDQALAKAGIEHKLVVVPGGGHDEKTWTAGLIAALEWFKAKLAK